MMQIKEKPGNFDISLEQEIFIWLPFQEKKS